MSPIRKNERTSKRVAAIAGKVLRRIEKCPASGDVHADNYLPSEINHGSVRLVCSVGELKALAASALTQAPDLAKKPAKKKPGRKKAAK